MGSEFIERNKRKSLLAALLLLLGGRGKYVAMLLVAAVVSVPFLLSGERLERLMSFPAVKGAMRAAGLTAPEAQIGSQAAADISAPAERRQASFWDRFLRAANAPLPPANTTTSTMAMLRGGADLVGPAVINEKGAAKTQPGNVKGVVNAEERAKGDEVSGVDLAGLTGAGPGGLNGDTMAQELGDRYGSAGPYANRTILAGTGGAADKRAGVYNQVMNTAAEGVPPPNSPKKLNARLGKVSGFSWRDMNAKTSRGVAIKGMRSKRPLNQLGEAFTMAGIAFESSTPEYESAYSGAVFDGNAIADDYLTTGDGIMPTVPSTAFAESLLSDANQALADAAACGAEATVSSDKIGDIGTEMKAIQEDMGDKPSCCGKTNPWNNKINKLKGLCGDMNEEVMKIASACPGVPGADYNSNRMDCSQYDDLIVNCEWYDYVIDCVLAAIAWATAIALGAIVLIGWAVGWWDMSDVAGAVQGMVNLIRGRTEDDPPEIPEQQQLNKEREEDLSGKS